jgi:hypothetical protein
MDASTVWKFLHIASMFVAVSIFVGQGMLSGAVARSGDVGAVRRILAAEDRFAPIGGGLFLLGIVFGFITAITSDFDLTETWLLIGYALSLFILVNGLTYHRSQAREAQGRGGGRLGGSAIRRAPGAGRRAERGRDERDRRPRVARDHPRDGGEAVRVTPAAPVSRACARRRRADP